MRVGDDQARKTTASQHAAPLFVRICPAVSVVTANASRLRSSAECKALRRFPALVSVETMERDRARFEMESVPLFPAVKPITRYKFPRSFGFFFLDLPTFVAAAPQSVAENGLDEKCAQVCEDLLRRVYFEARNQIPLMYFCKARQREANYCVPIHAWRLNDLLSRHFLCRAQRQKKQPKIMILYEILDAIVVCFVFDGRLVLPSHDVLQETRIISENWRFSVPNGRLLLKVTANQDEERKSISPRHLVCSCRVPPTPSLNLIKLLNHRQEMVDYENDDDILFFSFLRISRVKVFFTLLLANILQNAGFCVLQM